MNIARVLGERVATDGDRTAIVDNSRGANRTVTFAGMDAAASRIAARFHASGLRPGDAVLLLQPVSAELYILFTAILRSGLVAVFIDPAAGREHIELCCAAHPPKAFVGCARAHWLRLVSPAIRRIPLKFSVGVPVPGARRLDHRDPGATRDAVEDCPADSPAIIRFTSGSTGRPKAAVRSHGFLLAQHRVIERSFALVPGELDLVTMPMFVLSNLAAGVASLIPRADLRSPGSIPPASLLRDIRTYRPGRIGASPALLENLADHCAERGIRLGDFRKILTGGAPVFPGLLDKLADVAPNAGIKAVYGSTEAEPIALLDRREVSPEDRAGMAAGRGLLAGFPDEATRVCILRAGFEPRRSPMTEESFRMATAPGGEPGEVVVAGPHVQPTGREGDAAGDAGLRVAGTVWHRTGDAGYLDGRGRLWLLGRCGARISDGHGILHPFQVECVAHGHPGVRRAALLSHQGRRVLAIEAKGPVDAGELKSRLGWAFVDAVRIVSRIPVDKRHNAKIDYPALREMFRSE